MATGNRGATASGAHCDRQPSHHTHPRLHVRLRPLRPGREGGGLFHRKTRLDSARFVNWSMSSWPIRMKRSGSGHPELNDADPRVQVEVIPILVAALRKDSSETVRSSRPRPSAGIVSCFRSRDWRWRTQPSPTVRLRFGPRRGKHYGIPSIGLSHAPGAMMPSRRIQPSPRSPNRRRPPNHRPASRLLPLMQPPSAE